MTTLYIARTETRNYDFEGVGATEDDAMLALLVALARHAEQQPVAADWLADAVRIATEERRIRQIRAGGAYRDGEPLVEAPTLPYQSLTEAHAAVFAAYPQACVVDESLIELDEGVGVLVEPHNDGLWFAPFRYVDGEIVIDDLSACHDPCEALRLAFESV
jgi:hypothetical protein